MRREYASQHAALVAKFAPAATAPPPAGATCIDIDFPCGSDLETVYVDLAPGDFYGSLAAVCVQPVWRSELVRLGIPPHLRAAVCEVGLFDLLADCWVEAGGGNYPLPVRIGEAAETGRWVRAVLPTDPAQKRVWVTDLEARVASESPPVPVPAAPEAASELPGAAPTATRLHLSPEFLRDQVARLDEIGVWREEFRPEGDLLAIVWDRPTALAGASFPFVVQFLLDREVGAFDPDSRVFELWTDYLERHAEMLATLEADQAREATLYISRNAARREDHGPHATRYGMMVVYRMEENGPAFQYMPGPGVFGGSRE